MPTFIPAYDTENLKHGLAACRKIVEIHERFEMPATFFIVGTLVEKQGAEYKAMLGGHPLFELASHTYTHTLLRDHPICGPGAEPEIVRREVLKGVQVVEDCFGTECVGLRPGCGFDDGFQTAPLCLELAREAGLSYVSSHLWGPGFSMPSPLNQAYTYGEQGFPELWEIPGHGWHDNVGKWTAEVRAPAPMIAWPPIMPEAVPSKPWATSADEFATERTFVERAVAEDLGFVSLVWHPWSLYNFDNEMEMLSLIFQQVRDMGLAVDTYAGYCRTLQTAG